MEDMMERELIKEVLRRLEDAGYKMVIRVPFPPPLKIVVCTECCELERIEEK